MTTYFVAMHNNSVLLLALGLPFDRALPWHKLLALAVIFNSVVHGLTFYVGHRADVMPDAYSDYHLAPPLSKAYGMEISGVLSCCSTLANWCYITRIQVASLHLADWWCRDKGCRSDCSCPSAHLSIHPEPLHHFASCLFGNVAIAPVLTLYRSPVVALESSLRLLT
jgi:hypothetical protein